MQAFYEEKIYPEAPWKSCLPGNLLTEFSPAFDAKEIFSGNISK